MNDEFIRSVSERVKKMPKKKKLRSARELLVNTRRHVYLHFTDARHKIDETILLMKANRLEDCSDHEFQTALIELMNARHTLGVLLEHPVFLGVLADTKPNLTDSGGDTT